MQALKGTKIGLYTPNPPKIGTKGVEFEIDALSTRENEACEVGGATNEAARTVLSIRDPPPPKGECSADAEPQGHGIRHPQDPQISNRDNTASKIGVSAFLGPFQILKFCA